MIRHSDRKWEIVFRKFGSHQPGDNIKALQPDERSAIKEDLERTSKIGIPKEWPNTEYIRHKNVGFYQLRVGNHRVYLYLDTEDGGKIIVVCYLCRKQSNKMKQKDKDRVVSYILDYKSKKTRRKWKQ